MQHGATAKQKLSRKSQSVGGLMSKNVFNNKSWRKIKARCDFCVCIRHVSLFPASEVTKFRRCLYENDNLIRSVVMTSSIIMNGGTPAERRRGLARE